MKLIFQLLFWAYIAVAFCSTFPSGVWLCELSESFLHIHAMVLMGMLAFSVRKRSGLLALASGVVLLCAAWRLDIGVWEAAPTDTRTDMIVGTWNVYHHNDRYQEVAQVILDSGGDVVVIPEWGHAWDSAVHGVLAHRYPHAVRLPQADCCWGIALYSRYDVLADSVYHWTRDPVIRVTVAPAGREVDIWAMHTRPPIFPNDTEERDLLLRSVAHEIAERNRPAVLVGDLNVVSWASILREVVSTAKMRDTRSGLMPTYPMQLGVPLIPIDHVLHTEHFSTAFSRTGPIPGSDHKAFVAGLRWEERP